MKNRASNIAAAIAVSSLSMSLAAAGAPSSELPAPQQQGEVTYISGGAGRQEADAIIHVVKYYPLELEFLRKAKPKDEYLTGVKVQIKDEHHKMVLNVTSAGPLLLAILPAGTYTVSAERNHDAQNREVHIVAKEHRRVVFEWLS